MSWEGLRFLVERSARSDRRQHPTAMTPPRGDSRDYRSRRWGFTGYFVSLTVRK